MLIFGVCWILLLGIDYANKHPAYYYAFKHFRYSGLIFQFFLIFAVLELLWRYASGVAKLIINPVGLFILSALIMFLTIRAHRDLVGFESSPAEHMAFAFLGIRSALLISILLILLRASGKFIYDKLFSDYLRATVWLDIGLGLMTFMMIMFFLAAVGMFNLTGLCIGLAIMLIPAAYNTGFVLKSTVRSIDIRSWGLMGRISAFIIFTFLAINFISIQVPFPSGFDSRNYYINISQLVAQTETLIAGYPPYNGSLFIGLGLILYEYAELALSLSFINIVLAIGTAYSFSTHKLRVGQPITLLILAMITVIPALANQMFVELKVDFGLLYFQLLTVYYLFDTFGKWQKVDFEDRNWSQTIRVMLPFAAVPGLLLGYGLGIKMINLFLVIVVIFLVWWDKKNKYATAAALLLGLAVFLIAGIDNISGLRQYHENVSTIILLLGFFGLFMMIVSFITQRNNTVRKLTYSVLIGAFAFAILSPWLVKNYMDTGTLNPRVMLMGDAPGPDLGPAKMKKRYERSKKDDPQ